MLSIDEVRNHSVGIKPYVYKTIASYQQSEVILVLNYVFLCTLVALFGVISNIINMVVFYKQGLNSSINITFFALAISDLCGLLLQLWLDFLMNPWVEKVDLPIVPSEFQYLVAGAPRILFSRITCLITVYITMERCLCIMFPLHVKQMITPRRTAIAMVAIYMFKFMAFAPFYFTASIGWNFYPDRNKTLLGLKPSAGNEQLTQIVYIMIAFTGLASFIAVVIFTAILIRKLAAKSAWRKSANADQAKSETMSNKDRKTMSMIVLIATVLIVCYTPGVIVLVVPFVEPEFSVVGLNSNFFVAIWSFVSLFETTNSSVNIFLYLRMSTKYRETFRELFLCKSR